MLNNLISNLYVYLILCIYIHNTHTHTSTHIYIHNHKPIHIHTNTYISISRLINTIIQAMPINYEDNSFYLSTKLKKIIKIIKIKLYEFIRVKPSLYEFSLFNKQSQILFKLCLFKK
jgi:hypothetical protein